MNMQSAIKTTSSLFNMAAKSAVRACGVIIALIMILLVKFEGNFNALLIDNSYEKSLYVMAIIWAFCFLLIFTHNFVSYVLLIRSIRKNKTVMKFHLEDERRNKREFVAAKLRNKK